MGQFFSQFDRDVLSFVLAIWLAGIVVHDVTKRRVSNRWLLSGVILAVASLFLNASPAAPTWQQALTGGVGAFALLLCFYALGMMGAGDVKFAGVLGLWLGGAALAPIAVGAGLLAGVHALCWLARHRGPSRLGRRRCAAGDPGAEAGAVAEARTTGGAPILAIPYAGYLALAALLWVATGMVPASP